MGEEAPSLGEVARTMHRIEALLLSEVADHEARIRFLERRIWIAVGGVGALSTLSTILGIVAVLRG